MSDKNLRFLLFGEDKTASSTFHHTADEANSATSRIGGLFSKMGSAIGGEVGELVSKLGEGFEKLGEEAHSKLGGKLMAVGGIATGLGVAMQAMASKDVAAHQQLMAAVNATGKSYEGYGEEVEKVISHQEKYGHTAVDTQDALRVLTQALQDPRKAMERMNLVSDLAAAKHESLSEAALQVAKVYGGSGRVLKEFGITLDSQKAVMTALTSAQKAHTKALAAEETARKKLVDLEEIDRGKKKLTLAQQIQLKNAQDNFTQAQARAKQSWDNLTAAQTAANHVGDITDKALGKLGDRLKGQASASADTFSGKLAGMRAHLEDVGAQVAEHVGPALTAAGPVILGVGAIMESGLIPALGKAGVGLAQMGAKALVWGAEMLAAGIEAALPFLPLIAACAAVGVAAYLLWKNWDTVWGFIKGAISSAWSWIKSHVDYILMALGPIGIAIALLKDHWSQVWGAVKTAISDAWGFISPIFGWIKSKAIDPAVAGFHVLSDAWSKVWDGIKSTISGAWNFISDIVGRITGAISGIASTIGSALKNIPGLGSIGKALHIPGFASGVSDFAGGVALVGENGPELLSLPTHSSVTPSPQTMALLTHASSAPYSRVAPAAAPINLTVHVQNPWTGEEVQGVVTKVADSRVANGLARIRDAYGRA